MNGVYIIIIVAFVLIYIYIRLRQVGLVNTKGLDDEQKKPKISIYMPTLNTIIYARMML